MGEGKTPIIYHFNISGTSFGSISPKAIGSFRQVQKKEDLLITLAKVLYLNTSNGAFIIWQISTVFWLEQKWNSTKNFRSQIPQDNDEKLS